MGSRRDAEERDKDRCMGNEDSNSRSYCGRELGDKALVTERIRERGVLFFCFFQRKMVETRVCLNGGRWKDPLLCKG